MRTMNSTIPSRNDRRVVWHGRIYTTFLVIPDLDLTRASFNPSFHIVRAALVGLLFCGLQEEENAWPSLSLLVMKRLVGTI
jgi:hypothetical protein